MTYLSWLVTAANWTGPEGILVRLSEHLGYTVLTMLVAMAIALPLGAWIGHTRRGGVAVVGVANGLRALPELGVLTLFVVLLGLGLLPPVLALVLLAVPPLLAGTYSGVRNVDASVVDAAKGMGMRGPKVLWQVELPNALPLILGGIRSATLQVISTATVAAYVGIGGLGRFILDGLSQRDFGAMIGGSVLVALLAVVADLVLGGLQRLVVSPGLRGGDTGGRSGTRRLALVRGGREAA